MCRQDPLASCIVSERSILIQPRRFNTVYQDLLALSIVLSVKSFEWVADTGPDGGLPTA